MRLVNRIQPAARRIVYGMVLAFAATAFAGITHRHWELNSSTDWQEQWVYTNFDAWASSGRNYSTWTDPAFNPGVKYFDYNVFVHSNAASGCYEIYTEKVTGTLMSTDTRIYAQNGSSTWQSVSDDRDAATNRTSFARAWIRSSKGIIFRIQPFNANHNSIDLRAKVFRRKEATKEACRIAGKPFLDFSAGSFPTFFDTN